MYTDTAITSMCKEYKSYVDDDKMIYHFYFTQLYSVSQQSNLSQSLFDLCISTIHPNELGLKIDNYTPGLCDRSVHSLIVDRYPILVDPHSLSSSTTLIFTATGERRAVDHIIWCSGKPIPLQINNCLDTMEKVEDSVRKGEEVSDYTLKMYCRILSYLTYTLR